MAMNKRIGVLVVIMLLLLPVVAQCAYTLNFHNLTITKADSFRWKSHHHTIPDSIYIEPTSHANVTVNRWGYKVQFDTDSVSPVNYTITNHKWQNRKIILYVTGSPRQTLYADNTGTVTFTHNHQSESPLTYTLKSTWSFRNIVEWVTQRL